MSEIETTRQVFDALMEFVKADDGDLEEYRFQIADFQERYDRAEAMGASVTTLDFNEPGQIQIKITPGRWEQVINLEEVVIELECAAYNQGTIREWERVFFRLAEICRGKLRRLPPINVRW